MKGKRYRKFNLFTATVFWWIIIIGIIFIIFHGIELGWKIREYRYYSDEENFIEVTSEINHIVWDHSEEELYLGFSDIPEIFSDETFDITGDSFGILIDKDAEQYLKMGVEVTFVTAPRYFGDGYVMPIVALKAEDYELLDYEDGYAALMESYHILK